MLAFGNLRLFEYVSFNFFKISSATVGFVLQTPSDFWHCVTSGVTYDGLQFWFTTFSRHSSFQALSHDFTQHCCKSHQEDAKFHQLSGGPHWLPQRGRFVQVKKWVLRWSEETTLLSNFILGFLLLPNHRAKREKPARLIFTVPDLFL